MTLRDDVVTTSSIADDAVVTASIADGAVTAAKLATGAAFVTCASCSPLHVHSKRLLAAVV